MPLMRRGRGRRRGTRQLLIIQQVAVIRRAAFHRQRGRGLALVTRPVELQTGAGEQAEGELSPGGDGWGSRGGGGGGGGGYGGIGGVVGSGGHGEATVRTQQVQHLALWSLGPQRADRLGQDDGLGGGLQADLGGLQLPVEHLLVLAVPLLLLLVPGALPLGLVQLVLGLGVQLLWQQGLQGEPVGAGPGGGVVRGDGGDGGHGERALG